MPGLSPLKFLLFNSPHSLALLDPDLTTFLSSKHVAHTKDNLSARLLAFLLCESFHLPSISAAFRRARIGPCYLAPELLPSLWPLLPSRLWLALPVCLPPTGLYFHSFFTSFSLLHGCLEDLSCFLDDILTSLDVSLYQISPIVLPLSWYTSENQVAAQSGTINSWTSTVPGPASAPLHLPCLPPLWLSETLASLCRPLTSPSVAHRSPSTCHQGARLADCTHLSPPEGKMCPFLIYYGLNICTPKFTC